MYGHFTFFFFFKKSIILKAQARLENQWKKEKKEKW